MNVEIARWRRRAPTAAARTVYWIYGYVAFEWLFFVTKSSVVSSAEWPTRLLMLLVPPLVPLVAALPLQLMFSAFDARHEDDRRRWWSAILPASVALLLLVIGVENFARTVLGLGIVDVTPTSRGVAIACVVVVWIALFRRAARRVGPAPRGYVQGAIALIVSSSFALTCLYLDAAGIGAVRSTSAGADSRPLARPNILLVGIDGVPAQRMSLYGAARETTPFLESLSRRSIRFENAFPNAGVTCGSLISLLTGKRPTETHIFRCPVYLDGALAEQHLPALLRSAGYSTAQVGVDRHADAIDWNMRGAFDEVNGRVVADESVRSRSLAYARVRRFAREIEARIADRLLHIVGIRSMTDTHRLLTGLASDEAFSDKARFALAREFILGRREPWLLQIHLVDTHCCDFGFAPRRFSSETREGDARWMADRTDDALLQVDGYLAQLHGDLEASGQLERTMIIVYSDHSMGWGTNERVPLLVALPGQSTQQRVNANVQLLDIAPTILDQIGLPQPQWMAGQSLLDASRIDHLRPVFGLWGAWDVDRWGVRGRTLYEARTASVVVCDQWVEMSLVDGSVVRQGLVEGHTRPCDVRDLEISPSSLLVTHLRANGYRLPAGSSRVSSIAVARGNRTGKASR